MINAKWYNPFRAFWSNFDKKAEIEFTYLLKSNLNLKSKILDIGCGTGYNAGIIQNLPFKSYLGIDLTKEMLDIAEVKYGNDKRFDFKQVDVTKGIKSRYDTIISTWVMSHLDSPSKVINDAYAHLNNNGTLLFMFLTKPKWYVNFWFNPIIKRFSADYVQGKEIKAIKPKYLIKTYNYGLTSILYIKKR